MPAGMNELLHTIAEYTPFRDEATQRKVHSDIDELTAEPVPEDEPEPVEPGKPATPKPAPPKQGVKS